jgi:epoxyqueuosine reductase QueG
LRNLSVAAGNVEKTKALNTELIQALTSWLHHPVPWVREHMAWALAQQGA